MGQLLPETNPEISWDSHEQVFKLWFLQQSRPTFWSSLKA